MIFTDNLGTGKTTVARLMGRLFKAVNLLPRGHLVEVSRVDLVGQHVGETAVKTQGVVERATGGVFLKRQPFDDVRTGARHADGRIGRLGSRHVLEEVSSPRATEFILSEKHNCDGKC